jgi:hypothetical protein
MPTAHLFSYNLSSNGIITGCTQYGNMAVSLNTTNTIGFSVSNMGRPYHGPDEDLGYVIAYSSPSGTRTHERGSQLAPNAVGFVRSTTKTDASFVALVNQSFNQSFSLDSSGSIAAKNYLNANDYWASYSPPGTAQLFTTVGSTTWTAPAGVTSVEFLLVGGGGGGGNGYDTGGGAGGGGGMTLTGLIAVNPGQSYTVTVGFGGTGGAANRTNINGTNGGDSSFSILTALGGQGGQGSRSAPLGVGIGGLKQVSTTTAPTGGQGGGNQGTAVGGCGGGGGGAFGNGTNGTGSANNPGAGGIGGAGTASTISGSSVTYGAGGNGAKGNTAVTGATGTANTGKGGGGGCNVSGFAGAGGNGGSGIIILKYVQ